jgi:hypothetical protein
VATKIRLAAIFFKLFLLPMTGMRRAGRLRALRRDRVEFAAPNALGEPVSVLEAIPDGGDAEAAEGTAEEGARSILNRGE